MAKRILCTALLGALLLCLSACADTDITGSWESKTGSVIQFKSDGTAVTGTSTYTYEIDGNKTLVIDTQNGRQPNRFTWSSQTSYVQGGKDTWSVDGTTLRMGKNVYTKLQN